MVREGRRATSLVQENEVEGVSSQEKETLQALWRHAPRTRQRQGGGMSRSGPQVASFVREKHVERTERQFIGIINIYMCVCVQNENRGIQPPLKSNDMKSTAVPEGGGFLTLSSRTPPRNGTRAPPTTHLNGLHVDLNVAQDHQDVLVLSLQVLHLLPRLLVHIHV